MRVEKSTSVLEKPRQLLQVTSLCFLLASLASSACAAPAPSVPEQPVQAALLVSPTPILPTATREPSPTSTETPPPELPGKLLESIDPQWGSISQNEQGKLSYNSPLYDTEVGKNIPIVQQYREVGLDGGQEVWIVPEKYPNAPLFIQDLDTGEIRQGPFKYDNDVRRRLTMPGEGQLYYEPINKGLEGFSVPLVFSKIGKDNFGHDTYFVTMVPTSAGLVERDDHLVIPVKSYIGEDSDMLAYYYDLALGQIGPDNSYYNPWYHFYDSGPGMMSALNYITEPGWENFYPVLFKSMGMQIAVSGFYNMASIPQNTYTGNFLYAQENVAESIAVLSILKNAGIESVEEGLDYTSLSLYGAINLVLR